MKTVDTKTSLVHPKPFGSFLAGFDAITNHILLILFPVILDFIIWFGPHLRIKPLVDALYAQIIRTPGLSVTSSPETTQMTKEFWDYIAQRFNLVAILRTIPVGIPSLMSGRAPVQIPGGEPAFLEISSGVNVLLVGLFLGLMGLILGTFYYIVVSQVSLSGKVNWKQAVSQWPGAAFQVLVLTLFWIFLFLVICLPASCIISIFVLTGIPLGQITLFLFFGFLLWMFFPLLFSAHGIVMYRLNMLASVRYSVRVTRLNMPATGLFFLAMLLISQALDVVWRWPVENSWFALVGILGHGFISTGLLAASFIYYRDANQWLQKTLGLAV